MKPMYRRFIGKSCLCPAWAFYRRLRPFYHRCCDGHDQTAWHPTTTETGLVTSTALLASAIGAVLFGRVADLLGRKRIYGVEVLVLAAGAIASACLPNIVWLIIFRISLGLGIGGDYPVSATIMSE